MCVQVCLHVCVCLCVHVCVRMGACVHMHMLPMCLSVFMCVCVCVYGSGSVEARPLCVPKPPQAMIKVCGRWPAPGRESPVASSRDHALNQSKPLLTRLSTGGSMGTETDCLPPARKQNEKEHQKSKTESVESHFR